MICAIKALFFALSNGKTFINSGLLTGVLTLSIR